jgi:glycosyltransferase involved in cell wall biosynthesis
MKIYDCSNSPERPAHRGFGGPVENGAVTILKKYGPLIGMDFVDSPEECDLIFTNDVFPKSILNISKPRVKRMDGIFWQDELRSRNSPYLESCSHAHHLVFVSQYSRNAYYDYFSYYGKQMSNTVVLNWADEDIFFQPEGKPTQLSNYVAVATSWARPEKGLSKLLEISKHLLPNETLYLIGNMPDDTVLPDNVKSLGYMSDLRLAKTLRTMDAMINASYRDAAPKTMAEGICSGLPVFWLDSGGCTELAAANNSLNSYDSIQHNPNITLYGVAFEYSSKQRLITFRSYYNSILGHLKNRPRLTEAMVKGYYYAFQTCLER